MKAAPAGRAPKLQGRRLAASACLFIPQASRCAQWADGCDSLAMEACGSSGTAIALERNRRRISGDRDGQVLCGLVVGYSTGGVAGAVVLLQLKQSWTAVDGAKRLAALRLEPLCTAPPSPLREGAPRSFDKLAPGSQRTGQCRKRSPSTRRATPCAGRKAGPTAINKTPLGGGAGSRIHAPWLTRKRPASRYAQLRPP